MLESFRWLALTVLESFRWLALTAIGFVYTILTIVFKLIPTCIFQYCSLQFWTAPMGKILDGTNGQKNRFE